MMVQVARLQLASVIAVLALLSTGCGPLPQETPRAAPAFSFNTLDGKAIRLSDLKGSPVALNFWASWCPACATNSPNLQAIHERYAGDGLVVLGVAADDSEEALAEKARDLGITYPIAISDATADAYGVRAIPITFFIDKQGMIVSSVLGAASFKDLEAEVKKLL